MTVKELRKVMGYSNEILVLIDDQLRNDGNTLTRSDLQGAVDALVHKIMQESVFKETMDSR